LCHGPSSSESPAARSITENHPVRPAGPTLLWGEFCTPIHMLLALKARLAGFGLTLHEDKTRLIEFGRFAALSRQRRGERRPETFAFLGFTHYCAADPGWPVHREAQDGRETPDAQADGAAPGCLAAHARANGCAAQVVRRRSAWTLRLLRQAAQLSSAQRIPSANAPDMATVSETTQPEKPAHGLVGVRDPDGALPPANSAHHSNLGASTDMTRVTLGKSRVREIRPPGSVRAKAEWLSYSTTILVSFKPTL
ncbi:hypothetical protein NKH53_31310, partial [Mesorhizobium australicum]